MASNGELEILPEQVEYGTVLHEARSRDRARQRNYGKVQHRKFTGYDQSLPMVIYGFREETVHGRSTDGRPHTLVIFRWSLQQRKRGRRFKSARLKAVFRTTRTRDISLGGGRDVCYDPHVVTAEPNGSYSLLPDSVTISRTRGLEAGVEGGGEFAKGVAKTTYELSTTATGVDQIVINGAERNEYSASDRTKINDPDRCNVAEWYLFENATTQSGLPTFFRTAVLLERREGDTAQFTAKFSIHAEVDALTDVWTNFKRVIGLIQPDDPIIFDPSVEERGRLTAFKHELDRAPIIDGCKFVMFKNDSAAEMDSDSEKNGEKKAQGDTSEDASDADEISEINEAE
ncbi:uncharacterized protein F4822DRAFT_246582 [Hypoxylon trugodes]|uniref:uncharacterized protein n=1 Tax=Hypoxylon trugodes TaxID=326681 RepID=UPI0021990D6A|nr:uncharacterized protein F4822DRAFT_246582 [Hypoxylon trugodes]KAI1388436.1 hypothetical protein F4822DRAFT_246582 [Hypoxylon trugodes]